MVRWCHPELAEGLLNHKKTLKKNSLGVSPRYGGVSGYPFQVLAFCLPTSPTHGCGLSTAILRTHLNQEGL
ncbi:MAG: hypothetical protein NTX03_02545, partial [Bacteroidetes bacterium]|nr:hypothetical protein [Bacteroidota bacterium]